MDPIEFENNTNINILVLRQNTRTIISSLLNQKKLIPNEQGISRDWEGLSQLCGISGEHTRSISQDKDPTGKVLKLWNDHSKSEATVNKLINFLKELDRYDVLNDALPSIVGDIKYHEERLSNSKDIAPPVEDMDILTTDDLKGSLQFYDAYVLFDQDDIVFASEVIDYMEKNYNFKFFVKERDLLAGISEHDASIKLISRCRRLIVIFSKAFVESPILNFFYDLAQSISLEQRSRKIIPCIYKDCGALPPKLACYVKLDIRSPISNFWERLRDSVKPSESPRTKLSLPENRLEARRAEPEQWNNGRSASNSQQFLSPSQDTSMLNNKSQTVKFCSMNDLSNAKVPDSVIEPSTSANNLQKYEETAVKKTSWILKKVKSPFNRFISKSKNKSSDQQKPDILDEKSKEENYVKKSKEETKVNNDTEFSEKACTIEKKEKRKKFSLKRNKKKAVLADT